MENYVHVYIRRLLITAGIRLIFISAVFGLSGWLLYVTDIAPGFFLIAAIAALALALSLLVIAWLENRKLVRLKRIGAAYNADPLYDREFDWRSSITIRAFVKYTDSMGEQHIPKSRWYTIYTNRDWHWRQWGLRKAWTWGRLPIVPLSEIKLSATVYVNPDDHKDYAVELKVERRR